MNWLAFAILSYVALGVQVALRGFVEIGGAGPNIVLLVVVFLAINGTRDQSLIGGFVLGVMQDLLTLHPIGTWAVAYALVAMFVFSTQEIVYREHPLTHFSLALLGGILCGVVLTLHHWLYPMIHGKGSEEGGAVAFFGSAVYTAVLAPVLIGPLQRLKGAFGFRRRT